MEGGEAQIDRLPMDLLAHIFVFITCFKDLAQTSGVCRKWREGVKQSIGRKEKLSFAGWKMDDESTSRVVRYAYGLKELDISKSRWGCQITDNGLYQLSTAKCIVNLSSISLWGMTGITDKGVVQLISRASSLQHLNIGGTFITDESLIAIASSCPHLKESFLFMCVVLHRCCRTMSTNLPVIVKETIDLTDKEKQIFDRLLEVLHHFNLETNLRVAGGWVRDKLLGKDCYDIDIALDNLLGKEFCEKVNEYLTFTGEETQGIGVIQSNPDQSKHLETARMRLFDVWIDFVNLRSEDYAENSRIPTMRFGSAEQDAYRRDLTINSLFYNINTSTVEDFTNRGLNDLKSGIIATPLPPKETFLDDPLRVLRAIRFSARFEFEMVEELKVAAADNDVKSAIVDKISRERIGHEVDLMISGNQPVKAMTCISELGLLWVVFTPPKNCDPLILQEHDKICVDYMDIAWRHMHEIGCNFSDEQRRLYLYASLFIPLRKTVYIDTKNKTVPVVNYIFRNSLKLKASDADDVMKLHNAVEKFLILIPFVLCNEDNQDTQIGEISWETNVIDVHFSLKLRIFLGLLLKEIKDFWRAALMLATLLNNNDSSCEVIEEKLDRRRKMFKDVEQEILKLGLEKVWEIKPLINGKDIIKILELERGGPVVSEWQRKLLQWQLAYPSGTVEECVDWMTRQTQSKRART